MLSRHRVRFAYRRPDFRALSGYPSSTTPLHRLPSEVEAWFTILPGVED